MILAVPALFALWIWRDFHGSRVRQEREAVRAIAQFHQRFHAGEFGKICDHAFACPGSPDLRKAWQALLGDVRNRAGNFKSVSRSDITVYIEPRSVQANVVSVFDKTELREIFIMKDYDGPWESSPTRRQQGRRRVQHSRCGIDWRCFFFCAVQGTAGGLFFRMPNRGMTLSAPV
jgi:hypothetical protein